MASGQEELLFGRLALHYKLITAGQLEEVHGLHALAGGRRRLPEILVEMGYLSQRQVDQLLVVQRDYLEKRRAAQAGSAAARAAASAYAPAASMAGSDDTVAVPGGPGAAGAPSAPGAPGGPRAAGAPAASAPAAAAWPEIAATATPCSRLQSSI